MIKIRKGNDFVLTWPITVNKGEMTLEELAAIEELSVDLVDSNGDSCPAEYKFEEDSAIVRFLGKDQKRIGGYKLILYVNKGHRGQAVLDTCDAFYLTSCSARADINGKDGLDIVPEILLEGSNVAVGIKGDDGITPHIDPETGNWFLGNVDTGVHAQGEPGKDGLGDAPINGRHYGRKDGAWADLDTILNGKQNVINDLGSIRNGAAAGREALATSIQHVMEHAVPVPFGKDFVYYMSDVWQDSMDKTLLHVQYAYTVLDGFKTIELVYPSGTHRGSKLVVASIARDTANERKMVVTLAYMPGFDMTGELNMLLTRNKSNLVAAINEVNGKQPVFATDEEIDELFEPDYVYIDPEEGFIPVEPGEIITG